MEPLDSCSVCFAVTLEGQAGGLERHSQGTRCITGESGPEMTVSHRTLARDGSWHGGARGGVRDHGSLWEGDGSVRALGLGSGAVASQRGRRCRTPQLDNRCDWSGPGYVQTSLGLAEQSRKLDPPFPIKQFYLQGAKRKLLPERKFSPPCVKKTSSLFHAPLPLKSIPSARKDGGHPRPADFHIRFNDTRRPQEDKQPSSHRTIPRRPRSRLTARRFDSMAGSAGQIWVQAVDEKPSPGGTMGGSTLLRGNRRRMPRKRLLLRYFPRITIW